MAKKGGQNVEKRIKDPVSQMRIFTQGVKKQKKKQIVYENFQINQPQKINFYSQKPNNNTFLMMKIKNQGRTINGVDMDEKLNDQMMKSQLTGQMTDKLKSVTHVPKQKWNVPQTSNQQIGWFHQHFKPQNSKFLHKREGCPETHYADSYYTMKHTSLFSNHAQK